VGRAKRSDFQHSPCLRGVAGESRINGSASRAEGLSV
jgi:hypothetical protein